jgi:predicted acyltransferase
MASSVQAASTVPEPEAPEALTPAAAPAAAERVGAGPATSVPPARAPRLVSLDAFRGLVIVGMLLVNNSVLDTATPRQLLHAGWNQGLTFADMVFPWFLLIVGVSIPFSAAAFHRKGLPAWHWDVKAFSRAGTLILLGCLVDSSVAHQIALGLGVLQDIGLAFLVAALLIDLPTERRLVLAALFLVSHWVLLMFVPVPGAAAGLASESHNIVAHINQTFLLRLHLAGLLSVVPTAALVLIGTAVGDALRAGGPPSRAAAVSLVSGLLMAALGHLWAAHIPFSKSLWTASYVLYSAGLGTVVLGLLYWLMDVMRWRAWAFPLVPMGMNALLIYVVPILTKAHILGEWHWRMPDGSHLSLALAMQHWCFEHLGRVPGGWLYTLGYVAFWWLVALVLYRRRVFWRA